jgi:hypothetical protein
MCVWVGGWGGWVGWLCGCVVVWLCGCLVVWLCGCVVAWLRGCVVVWLCGCVVIWVPTYMIHMTPTCVPCQPSSVNLRTLPSHQTCKHDSAGCFIAEEGQFGAIQGHIGLWKQQAKNSTIPIIIQITIQSTIPITIQHNPMEMNPI